MPTIDEALQIGWKRHQGGDVRGAEQIYRQVLQAAPANANGWCFLGMACHDQQRYDEAVAAYHQALQYQPNFPIALSNLGNTLKQQGKLIEAEASCRQALKLKPDYSTAYNNLGVALVAQGRLQEASETFERALSLVPTDAVAHTNLSAALVRQGKYEEAEVNSQQALKLNPNYAEAHKNQAIVWLLLGDFERGWPEYEWRWKCPGSGLANFAQPRWDGGPLQGKTLLLVAEQGLGDSIQFIRYARMMQERGARVLFKCPKPLMKLLANYPHIDQLMPDDAPLPDYDCYIPLLSIPGVLRTNLNSIPGDTPYLQARPDLVAQWRQRLAKYDGFKIGIAWQGSPQFHADAQRSLPLRHFAELAAVPGVRLFSLQKGFGTEQIAAVRDQFEVLDFGDELDTTAGPFMDTAAIMQCMDLVVTSCTSVVHLAGALHVPTWVALSIAPDWRWLLDRDDTPWYPSMRLFRQTVLGDWETVFKRMGAALRERAGERAAVVPHVAADVSATTTSPVAVDRRVLLDTGFNRVQHGRHGVFLFNRHDVYIGRSLQEYGEFSEREIERFRRIVRPGDVVVEAGANIGSHTVPLAKLVGPTGRVWAFEPQRLVFQTLCANVALNSLTNVECQLAAVGASPGEIVVPHVRPDSDNNFGGLGLGRYQAGDRRPVVTIDSLQLSACRLIKADVEGMELAVLQGAAETLQRCRPVLYLENDRDENSRALIGHVLSLGYRLFWHLPLMFNADNYYRNPDNVFGKVVSFNMLCLLPEHEFVADGLPEIKSPDSDRYEWL